MRVERLRGWNVRVEKRVAMESGDDEWALIFEEKYPPTGNVIVFEMNRETRDEVVKALTDGIVLAGGGFPKV